MSDDRQAKTPTTNPPESRHEALIAPSSFSMGRELLPLKKSELNPSHVTARVLAESKPYLKALEREIRAAHSSEPCDYLKSVRAIDTLVNSSFRLVSQGPEFLFPAIVTFLKAGQGCKKQLGIQLPSLQEALCDIGEHDARHELIPAHRLHDNKLRDLIRGSTYMSSSRSPMDMLEEVHCGVPLIEVGVSLARLPSADNKPVETALLTHAFLTLIEETLHACQSKRIGAQNELHNDADHTGVQHKTTPEAVLLSRLAIEFLQETEPHTVHKAQQLNTTSRLAEIDVVGKIVELAEEHGFPKECLFAELTQNHVEIRKDFVRWLVEHQHAPALSADTQPEFYFKARGQAEKLHAPNSAVLSDDAKDLYELLEDVAKSKHLRTIRTIIGDPAEFAALQRRAESLGSEQMIRVLDNLSHCVKTPALPPQWLKFAKEEYEVHKLPLAAVVLEEHLRGLGLLTEKK